MAERSLAIRLSLRDAEQVRAALRALGEDGQAALAKIEAATDPTSRALDRLKDRVDPASRAAKQLSRDSDTLAAALAKGKISLEEHNRLLDLSKPVTVAVKGQTPWRGTVKPDFAAVLESWRSREDPKLVYPARVRVELGKQFR